MSKLKGTPIPEDFQPNESTLAWLEKRYPQIDVEVSVERFLGWACNYSYQSHQRTYQNFIMRTADENKLGPMLKRVQKSNEWESLNAEGLRVGFRTRVGTESVEQFKAALEAHRSSRAGNVSQLVKAFGK